MIRAPYLPYDKLRKLAYDFQETYNPDREIPVPIESIVEFDFKMDIVPVPGLEDGFDIDSYITSDLKEIRVDDSIYRTQETRYRFSLAHELSHKILHADVFSKLTFSTVQEWKKLPDTIPQDAYTWIESHAYSFAGLILVPEQELKVAFEAACESAEAAGIDLKTADHTTRRFSDSKIAKQFNVSVPVIKKRLIGCKHVSP